MDARKVWSTGPDAGRRESRTVAFWGLGNKFGFLRRNTDPRGKQVLHESDLPKGTRYPLDHGTPLTFVVLETAKGLRAQEARLERARA